jgi:protein-tyrosine phosphatase
MLVDFDIVKVAGNHLYLSQKPCVFKNKPEINKLCMDRFLNLLTYKDIKTVVVLLAKDYMVRAYGRSLVDIYRENGQRVIHYPIPDFDVPEDILSFHRLIEKINNAMKKGNVLIHCRQGLGRTGMVAAGLAIYRGFKPDAAISIIRRVRPLSIETEEQEKFLKEYYPFSQMREWVDYVQLPLFEWAN